MAIKISKTDTCNIPSHCLVKFTEMGNIAEIQYMSRQNKKQTIKCIGDNKYIYLETGEVKEFVNHETRAEQKKSIYRTFALARKLINTNLKDVEKVRWITLTYRENMTDTKQLYDDFRKFHMRFKYYCECQSYGVPEYIVMMEPQGRGAWHAHLLYIWETKAPYIPNEQLAKLWRQGFTKITKLENCDNVGAYLTAYLGDMDLEEMARQERLGEVLSREDQGIKQVDMIDENGQKKTKYFVKGGRLNLYPAGFRMIRFSKGIKRPIETEITYAEAKEKVKGATLTFEKEYELLDSETDFKSIISKQEFNLKRKII